jgi:hypothetical protein
MPGGYYEHFRIVNEILRSLSSALPGADACSYRAPCTAPENQMYQIRKIDITRHTDPFGQPLR